MSKEELDFLHEVMVKRFIKVMENPKFYELDNPRVIDVLFDAVDKAMNLKDDVLHHRVKERAIILAQHGMERTLALGEKKDD